MKIETKFSLDDTVVSVTTNAVSRKVKCFTCEQTGKVFIQGEEFVCPKCKGACLREEFVGYKSVIDSFSVIGKVSVEVVDPKFCYHPAESIKVKYMLVSTGIGSGTLWDETNLFATREEAQAECDRRNTSLILHDDTL